ncbi:hypothetical protein GSI_13253 [Ganoderma sinense ZZ0214-1]|uniref:Uncharacterized protein n=1 Tax=Ganoderma sinense ZZ0214-1 TaxID=1077348 RepID=A0A2G8RV32_9APHY|nr:hypothetical protein GSI_13253 [Ganoderma sinense ZZ0214-1]
MTPSIAPLDKAGASTRILLHDTQAHLERFGERVVQLTTGVADAKRELVAVQKLYQEDHEQLVERMIGLANRCQTELQKTIGTPAQSSELRDVLKAVEGLGKRMEALDKKVDVLSMVGQTQSQALQNLQDQQGQALAALLPLLPLLQAVPLHIENARNHVKDVVTDSKSDVQRWIMGVEDRVQQSSDALHNQLQVFLPQDPAKKGLPELPPHDQDHVSDLQRHISTPVAPGSPGICLTRGTPRFRSASQKRPRSGSPSDTSSSDPAASPSGSKRQRLGNPSGRAASTARPARPSSVTGPRRIHTPTVPTTGPPSLSHASPDLSLLPATVRSSDRLIRTPLADLDPRTPNVTGTPASIMPSVPKHQQLRGSRSTLLTRPSPSPAGAPSRTPSPQSNIHTAQARARTQARAQVLPAPAGSTMTHTHTRTPPPIIRATAPITPGAFKLPLPSLGLSRTATATPTPQLRTTTLSQAHSTSSSSSLRHPPGQRQRSARTPGEAQASRTRSNANTLRLSASRGVAVHDSSSNGDGAARVSRASERVTVTVPLPLPIGVGAGGGAAPRTPHLPADARSVAPLLPPPPPSQAAGAGNLKGKPMSLRDRRAMAMLAEDRLRDEGKRFIPLDDEEDEEDADANVAG